jgi:alkyl hydroperoxide reductase subunit AhpC
MVKHLVWLCLVSTACASAQDAVDMKMLQSGASRKLQGYYPQRIDLSTTRPSAIKKLPDDLQAPMFGMMPFRLASGVREVVVVLDKRAGKLPGLYIDANGNGDLTDDPPVQWRANSSKVYMSEASLLIGDEKHSSSVSVSFYHFHDDPNTKQYENSIAYYRDYAPIGQITLAGKTFQAALDDSLCTGDYRGKNDPTKDSGVWLMIDTNDSGKFSRQPGKQFDVRKPFNIGGITYELHDMASDGRFNVVRSAQQVAEIAPPPNLEVGHTAPAFTAQTMDGKAVHFPDDYKGHIVMLDFWATWCGPCMGEVPGLASAYEKFHPRGFEVLGITLDNPNSIDKINSVLKEHKMAWPEVYDGKGWKATVAEQYGIQSIPSPILVDGDTGKILASLTALRGDSLESTLEKALAARSK